MNLNSHKSSLRRVAFVVPDCGDGGLFQFYNQLIPVLAKHVEVHVVFASPFRTADGVTIAGARCISVDPQRAVPLRRKLSTGALGVFPNVAQMLATAHLGWQAAAELDPDLIEVCDWPLGLAPAVLQRDIPYVVQCHGSAGQIAEHDIADGAAPEEAFLRLVEAQTIAHAYRVQTYSSANRDFWQNTTSRVVQLIRPALSLQPFAHLPLSDAPIAVFGRLQAWKGPDILLSALQALGSRAPAVDWYGGVKRWPGTNTGADAYLRATFSSVWGSRFQHRHAVDRDAVALLQSESLCTLVPSTWDVFNFTAVEAMSRGKPVLVSCGAGASELIETGINGITFPANDGAALAAALEQFLGMSPAARATMGQAGRETVRTQLEPARIATARLAAYHEALEGFPNHQRGHTVPWLNQLLCASGAPRLSLEDFCNTLPLRPMMRSVGRRLLNKLTGGVQ
jgi:glycosyltransferase involved in cell wall biosynthesis